jgi:hypothetical protein
MPAHRGDGHGPAPLGPQGTHLLSPRTAYRDADANGAAKPSQGFSSLRRAPTPPYAVAAGRGKSPSGSSAGGSPLSAPSIVAERQRAGAAMDVDGDEDGSAADADAEGEEIDADADGSAADGDADEDAELLEAVDAAEAAHAAED